MLVHQRVPQIINFWQDFPYKSPKYEASQLQLPPREKYHDAYYKVVPQIVS